MSFSAYTYRIPFIDPLQTSLQTLTHREGFVFCYRLEDKLLFGEAAPLEGFSKETMKEIRSKLAVADNEITTALGKAQPVDALSSVYEERDFPPSMQFGLDSLAYQIEAHRNNHTLADHLFPRVKDKIPLNALVSLHSDSLLVDVQQRIDQGFKTLKFKIGMDFKKEYRQLKAIRSHFSGLTFRTDANGAWTIDEALENCQYLSELKVAYCEEPLSEPTPHNFERLSSETSLPLALDESVLHTSYWPNLLPFSSVIVLKPMFLGNFTNFFETIRLANTHDTDTVITSSLESGIGRSMAALLASGIDTELAHGLNTGELLEQDLTGREKIIDGKLHLTFPHPGAVNIESLIKVV